MDKNCQNSVTSAANKVEDNVDKSIEINSSESWLRINSPKRLVIFGVIVFILSAIVKDFCPVLEDMCMYSIGANSAMWLISELCNILHEGSIAIFISASMIFALETNHYKNYFTKFFEERVINLLMKDSYVEKLDEQELKELQKNINSRLLFGGRLYDESGLWSLFTERLSKLINDVYFTDYDMQYIISVKQTNDDAKVFYISAEKSLVVKNPTNKTINYKIPVNSTGYSINKLKNDKLYVVKFVEINGKEIDNVEIKTEKNSNYKIDRSPYDLSFTCERKVPIEAGESCKINIKVVYIIPEKDNILSSTVIHPCNNYRVSVFLDTNEFIAEANAFTFHDKNQAYNGARKGGNGKYIEIKVDDWLLPGEGVSVVLGKNDKVANSTKSDKLSDDFYEGC